MSIYDDQGRIQTQMINQPFFLVGPDAGVEVRPTSSNFLDGKACSLRIVVKWSPLFTISSSPEDLHRILSDALVQVQEILDQNAQADELLAELEADPDPDPEAGAGAGAETPEARVERSIQQDLLARKFRATSL
jgi:hypothetical protein